MWIVDLVDDGVGRPVSMHKRAQMHTPPSEIDPVCTKSLLAVSAKSTTHAADNNHV
jgi:hypothetical protein